MQRAIAALSERAETMTTGVRAFGAERRTAESTAKPPMPGIMRSSRIASKA